MLCININSLVVRMCVCAQLCLILCSPMDCSLPGSCICGFPWISQARILEWVAISSSRGSSRPRDQTGSPVSPAVAGRFPYHQCHLGSPSCADLVPQICKMLPWSRVGNSKKTHRNSTYSFSQLCVIL